MRDYVIPKTNKGIPWIYLYKQYQKELDNQINSLIDYQILHYPFFRIVNNTTLQEFQKFLPLSTTVIEPPEATNNQTLLDYGYVYFANVISDQDFNDEIYTNPLESLYILFINKLNKHQGVVIFFDKFYFTTYDFNNFISLPGIILVNNTIYISNTLWQNIIYKPSVLTYYKFLLGATNTTNSRYNKYSGIVNENDPTLPVSSFALFQENAAKYYDFSTDTEKSKPSASGSDFTNFNQNSINFLLEHNIGFVSDSGILMPDVSNQSLLMPLEVGTIVFSNTWYHDIDLNLKRTLLFHLSNFDGAMWTYNQNMKINYVEEINDKYGYTFKMPLYGANLRWISQSIFDLSKYYSMIPIFRSRSNKEWCGHPVIAQTYLNNSYEEIVGDFYFQNTIGKIDNETKYFYTITNKTGNDTTMIIQVIAI